VGLAADLGWTVIVIYKISHWNEIQTCSCNEKKGSGNTEKRMFYIKRQGLASSVVHAVLICCRYKTIFSKLITLQTYCIEQFLHSVLRWIPPHHTTIHVKAEGLDDMSRVFMHRLLNASCDKPCSIKLINSVSASQWIKMCSMNYTDGQDIHKLSFFLHETLRNKMDSLCLLQIIRN
jgi:hypothetical protein